MFVLCVNTRNAAFEDGPQELARILRGAADKVEAGRPDAHLRDVNGNLVGEFSDDLYLDEAIRLIHPYQ